MANIEFVPPQMGPVTSYSTRALRSGPLWLMVKDAGVLSTVLPYLPWLFLPMTTGDKRDNYLRLQSKRDIAIQGILLVLHIILAILFLPALWLLPGLVFILLATLCILLTRLIAWPTQGDRIRESRMDDSTLKLSQQHTHERWVFINGICTGSSGLQQNIDRLSLLFGRKVLGIHNQSYGFISDILECLLQRCMSYSSLDVRIACEILKDQLVDEEVKKVVLVAHSQGGIIASMVVDFLLRELGGETMAKLEIYTFGSAASHFFNPPKDSIILPFNTSSTSPCIPHIEHYANEYDMVPRWGVLYAVKGIVTNRYAGHIFVRKGASGHMFVEHYLDPIFPLPGSQKNIKMKYGATEGPSKAKKGDLNGRGVEEADTYLDAIVDVDTDTQMKRKESKPKSLVQAKDKRGLAELKGLSVPRMAGAEINLPNEPVDGFGGQADGIIAAPARGKRVKELSRLWKYLGGASPVD